MSTFGSRLKEIRENLKLSREEFANKLNISYTALSKYETDKRFPSEEILKNIAEGFEISIDYLIGVSNKTNKGSVGMNDFDEIIKNMQLQKVIGELNALKVSYYNSSGIGLERYKEVKKLIDKVISDLENELG